jgi:hypothetical protein
MKFQLYLHRFLLIQTLPGAMEYQSGGDLSPDAGEYPGEERTRFRCPICYQPGALVA